MNWNLNWNLFVSIYILIFVAELPDKTAFATLLLATRSKPAPVFIGVALAFLVQTFVALLFGSLIGRFPPEWVHLAAGVMFLIFAAQMWRTRNEGGEEETERRGINTFSFLPTLWGAFVVIFVAEWGDLTQIATGTLAAKYPKDILTVGLAACAALWSVTLVAVILGGHAKKYIDPVAIKKYATCLFALIGLYFVYTALRTLIA